MMKKLLLLAAMAAMALGASAGGYTFEKLWETTSTNVGLAWADTRQGFGMDGKFYINDKGTQTIYVIDENGVAGTLPGGPNCGINRDEAGHIILSTWTFPGNAAGGGIRVIDPESGETLAEFTIPEECGFQGRCDFIGKAKGDLTEDGAVYLFGGNTGTDPYTDGVAILTITGGEVDEDNCYRAPIDGIHGINTTAVHYWTDLNGEDALLFDYRSGPPSKLNFDGEFIIRHALTLPSKGASNGAFPFVWDNKEFYLYTSVGAANYLDCFAIAEDGAEEPIIVVPATISAAINNFQANLLNAEVDADGVTIYKYYPGGQMAVYRLTKEAEEMPNVYMLGGDDQPWDPTSGTMFDYDAENNVYTATINFPADNNYFGFTTELAEYNDEGGWIYIEPFRFGAVADPENSDEDTNVIVGDQEFISLTWDEYHAIRIAGGEYNLTISLEEMKLYVEKVSVPKLGDVNDDGFVNITDVTMLINAVLNDNFNNINTVNANMNGDDAINITDVTMLITTVLAN